jgi:hypothetical protein
MAPAFAPCVQVYTFDDLRSSVQELLSLRHAAITEGGKEMAKLLAASSKTLKINKCARGMLPAASACCHVASASASSLPAMVPQGNPP